MTSQAATENNPPHFVCVTHKAYGCSFTIHLIYDSYPGNNTMCYNDSTVHRHHWRARWYKTADGALLQEAALRRVWNFSESNTEPVMKVGYLANRGSLLLLRAVCTVRQAIIVTQACFVDRRGLIPSAGGLLPYCRPASRLGEKAKVSGT